MYEGLRRGVTSMCIDHYPRTRIQVDWRAPWVGDSVFEHEASFMPFLTHNHSNFDVIL